MIFINKRQTPPPAYLVAVSGLQSYHQLQGDNKQVVIDLLLAEQGGLCAICERDKFGCTIEHFLPASHNPSLDLDYRNLYVTCQPCNGPKAEFLVPPYIFDRRFDPCGAKHPLEDHNGIRQVFEASADKHCYLKIPAATVPMITEPKAAHLAAYILYYSTELMAQNRHEPEFANLAKSRGTVLANLRDLLPRLADAKILEEWDKIINARSDSSYRFPEFVSIHLQELSRERKKRGI